MVGTLPKLLSAAEYGQKWGYSRATVIEWCRSGKIADRQCQFVGGRMWVIAAGAVRKNKYLEPEELKLLNDLSDTNPLTGKPKTHYAVLPERMKGLKAYALPGLQREREAAGYNKGELATLCGVDVQVIMRAEKGRRVRIKHIRALADGLEVWVGDLLRSADG